MNPEKFDFSKLEDQEQFNALPKEAQETLKDGAYEEVRNEILLQKEFTKKELKENPDLRIGRSFAELNKLWYEWREVVRFENDPEKQKITAELAERMDKLRPESHAEFIAAVLKAHGYLADTKEVFLQPYSLIGWGENRSTQYKGEPVSVKIEDIIWTEDNNPYRVYVTIRGSREHYKLVMNPNIETRREANRADQEQMEEIKTKIQKLLTELGSPRAETRGNAAHGMYVTVREMSRLPEDQQLYLINKKKDMANVLVAHLGDSWDVVNKCVDTLIEILDTGVGNLAPFIVNALTENNLNQSLTESKFIDINRAQENVDFLVRRVKENPELITKFSSGDSSNDYALKVAKEQMEGIFKITK